MLRLAPRLSHCLGLLAMLLLPACGRTPDAALVPAAFDYAGLPAARDCPALDNPAPEGKTPEGVRFIVRTPSNYRPDIAHPLLVVYAPAGHGPQANERFTRFTHEATARGWLVAYVEARPMALPTIRAMAEVPAAVQARWCVDAARIHASGHSDGGTLGTAIAVLPGLPRTFAAIAPSAAGFRGEDLQAYRCPAPTPVFILHNRQDDHFPGYGREAARWWAGCNGCAKESQPAGEHCLDYTGCATDATVRYCEPPGGHRQWPGREREIIDFLARWQRRH